MQYTTNYHLKKPEGTDFYNVDDFNDNMDAIDNALDSAGSEMDYDDQTVVHTAIGSDNANDVMKYNWIHIPGFLIFFAAIVQNAAYDSYTLPLLTDKTGVGQLSVGDQLIPYHANSGNSIFHANISPVLYPSSNKTIVHVSRDFQDTCSTALIQGVIFVPVSL